MKESRALVVNPRSFELLEPTGVVQAMRREGRPVQRARFYQGWERIAQIDLSDAHPRYSLTVLPQARTETLLAGALVQYGVRPERRVRFESFALDAPASRRSHVRARRRPAMQIPFRRSACCFRPRIGTS